MDDDENISIGATIHHHPTPKANPLVALALAAAAGYFGAKMLPTATTPPATDQTNEYELIIGIDE